MIRTIRRTYLAAMSAFALWRSARYALWSFHALEKHRDYEHRLSRLD